MAADNPFSGFRVNAAERAQARKNRGNYTAEVDTAGMDPEMKSTLSSMRGPFGSSGGTDQPSPFAGINKAVNYVQSIFKGAGKKNAKQVVKH